MFWNLHTYAFSFRMECLSCNYILEKTFHLEQNLYPPMCMFLLYCFFFFFFELYH